MTRKANLFPQSLQDMPAEHQALNMMRRFSAVEWAAISSGYLARGRKHKWIVVFEESTGRLRFYRRERGYCIYEMICERAADGTAVARQLVVNRNHCQHYCWCDVDEIRMCNYLVDTLLLQKTADFPLPLDMPQVRQQVAAPAPEDLPRADNDENVLLDFVAGRTPTRLPAPSL